MNKTKDYLSIIWLIVFLGVVSYILTIDNSPYMVKNLYILLLIITFPLGILGMLLMNTIASIFSASHVALFVAMCVLFFILGYIQWVVLLGRLINFILRRVGR